MRVIPVGKHNQYAAMAFDILVCPHSKYCLYLHIADLYMLQSKTFNKILVFLIVLLSFEYSGMNTSNKYKLKYLAIIYILLEESNMLFHSLTFARS